MALCLIKHIKHFASFSIPAPVYLHTVAHLLAFLTFCLNVRVRKNSVVNTVSTDGCTTPENRVVILSEVACPNFLQI